jgi:hypothetical protein
MLAVAGDEPLEAVAVVAPGKIDTPNCSGTLDFLHPAQITVDSFFHYLYHPPQTTRFDSGLIGADGNRTPEMT